MSRSQQPRAFQILRFRFATAPWIMSMDNPCTPSAFDSSTSVRSRKLARRSDAERALA
jgi:hypothetical protein